jgi:predicted Zn-dependent peptidase
LKIIKKRLKNNVDLKIIPTTKFKTVVLNIGFKGPYKQKDITALYLLSKIMADSSKKYPKAEFLARQQDYLYGTAIQISSQLVGELSLFSLTVSLLDPKLISSKFRLLEKVIDLIVELIYRPNIVNGLFEQQLFETTKSNHMYRLKSLENDKESVAAIRMKELVDDDHPYRQLSLGNLQDLTTITNQDLVNLYKDLLNREIEIYVLGDVSAKDIVSTIEKKFKAKSVNKKIKTVVALKQDKVKKIIEIKKFNQSHLSYLLTTNTLVGDKDYYPMIMFNAIFGRTPLSKLFRVVREKNSLCYSISSSYQVNYGFINVGAGIDAKNYKKADSLIRQQLTLMKQGSFTQEDINMNRNMLITMIEHTYDQPVGLVNQLVTSDLIKTDMIKQDYIDNLNKVTKAQIIKAAKKVEIKIEYLLKQGDKNEAK